ncbi:hypothetical protein [Bacillus marinisedimentorum]|nr:hypothetical protein [Bacillus marinisedimentorum]
MTPLIVLSIHYAISIADLLMNERIWRELKVEHKKLVIPYWLGTVVSHVI